MNSDRISLPGPLFIFGAYGKTGALIAKTAIQRGHRIVLSGGDRDRLNRISTELGAPAAPVRLEEGAALRKLIRSAACVIHAAGPFGKTFRPMLEACSTEGVPYMDLNGELDVFRSMEGFVTGRQFAIPILSGAGFGVVAGESAAMHAAARLEQPHRVWLGLMPDVGLRSPGATASTLQALAQGGAVIRNGHFVAERMGRRSFAGTLAGKTEKFISMPLGELWAVRRSTGASTVIAGVARPAPERLLLRSGVLQLVARSPKIRDWLASRAAGDGIPDGRVFESKAWARAEDANGRSAEVLLTMGEGYLWSAESAVRLAEQVSVHRRPGLWTPGQYLGKEFALSVSSTKLFAMTAGVPA